MDPEASPDAAHEPPGPRRGRRVLLAVGAVVTLLAAGYAALVAVVSGDVPKGTSVRGVQIGGMTSEQAVAALQAELADDAAAPIPVKAGDATTEIKPAEAGLAVDWAATVEQASGLILNPVSLIAHLRGEVELEPVTTIDDKALTANLKTLDEVAAEEPVEPRIRFNDKTRAKLRKGVPGQELDIPEAAKVVTAAYLQSTGTVGLPMTPISPEVPDEAAERVLEEFAKPAVAKPVTVRARSEETGRTKLSAQPADIAAALSFTPEGDTLAPSLDAKVLHERLASQLAELERPGRDASIVIRDGKPTILPSRKGLAVLDKDLGKAVFAVLPETSEQARKVTLDLKRTDPDFTTAEAKALNIKEKLSSFLQRFPPAPYRYVNVGQAAEYLNGTILSPGETFSMNDTVKERTAANGYTEGFIISNGRFREDLGGGVSIITTATWTAGFYAGLERVEQQAHALYIDRYQAGLEATVAWGYIDLKMRNDTGNGVLITATRYNDGVLVEMWGTKKWDEVTATFTPRHSFTDYQTIYDADEGCVPSEGSKGFSIAVTRRRLINGNSTSTETWPTTYQPTPNVVCGPQR